MRSADFDTEKHKTLNDETSRKSIRLKSQTSLQLWKTWMMMMMMMMMMWTSTQHGKVLERT
jgi:hypothetical protein